MSEQSFEQHVMALYGKSVYAIELEIAAGICVAAYREFEPDAAAQEGWHYAEAFIRNMRKRYEEDEP